MTKRSKISSITKTKWGLDIVMASITFIAIVSGLYFFFLPTNGFQGGRNVLRGVTILFTRQAWDSLHVWTGVAMVAIVIVHLALNWKWLVAITKRTWHELTGRCPSMSLRCRINTIVNIATGISFLATATSGIYFLFVSSHGGGRVIDPLFIVSRATWDSLHTWSAIAMIGLVLLHIVLHWKWITNVAGHTLGTLRLQSREFTTKPRNDCQSI